MKKATRNHSIGMPLVRVIPSLMMMTWNKEALKAFNGKPKDLACRYLGNGRLVLHTPTQTKLSKKITRDRGDEGSVEFKLRLVINKNRAISRTPTKIVEFLRKNHLSGPFIGRTIKGYSALFVNFSEPASGENVSLDTLLEEAPVVKFPKKAPKAKRVRRAKPKKAARAARAAKPAKPAKPAKKAAAPAPAKKKAKKVAPPAAKTGATIRKVATEEKVEPKETEVAGTAVVEEDEALSAPVEVTDEEEEWGEQLDEIAAEEDGDDDDSMPSPIRATVHREQE